MITPTVGRVVHYFDDHTDAQPNAAIITYVHSDTMVNLAVFDMNGLPFGQTSVYLVQDGHEVPSTRRCEWMPFQKGQAQKTEALEAQLAKTP